MARKGLAGYAKDINVGVKEWRQLTGQAWSLDTCRSALVKKINDWVAEVVLTEQDAPKGSVALTRKSSGGTMVKISYAKVVLESAELTTRDPSKVGEILKGIASDIDAGEYDKELQEGYEKTRQLLKK